MFWWALNFDLSLSVWLRPALSTISSDRLTRLLTACRIWPSEHVNMFVDLFAAIGEYSDGVQGEVQSILNVEVCPALRNTNHQIQCTSGQMVIVMNEEAWYSQPSVSTILKPNKLLRTFSDRCPTLIGSDEIPMTISDPIMFPHPVHDNLKSLLLGCSTNTIKLACLGDQAGS